MATIEDVFAAPSDDDDDDDEGVEVGADNVALAVKASTIIGYAVSMKKEKTTALKIGRRNQCVKISIMNTTIAHSCLQHQTTICQPTDAASHDSAILSSRKIVRIGDKYGMRI